MSKVKVGKNWSSAEWLKVATMALDFIERGTSHVDALKAAQVAVLPRKRWREPQKLAHAAAPSNLTWPKYLAKAKAMTKTEREAVLLAEVKSPDADASQTPQVDPTPTPPEKKRTKAAPGTGTKYSKADKRPADHVSGVVRWSRREWALIARAAKWVSEQTPSLSLAQQVNEAQVWALPADRLRPYGAIMQSWHVRNKATGKRILAMQLADGLERGWTINQVPFTPPGSEPEKTAVAEAIEELASPPVAIGPSVDTVDGPRPALPSPAAGGALPTLSAAAQAFGETMMRALDGLLAVHSHHLLTEVNARIATMAADTGNQVAALIEAGMRRTVHSIVEQELGGPTNPPAPPADEPANVVDTAPIPGEAPPRKRLKVDVVGSLNPPMRVLVRDQFNGSDVDLRFFEGGHHERYTPDLGRHCIFVSKRASHGLFDKLKKYKVKPIYVEPNAGVIAHAIEELQRSAMQ